MARPSWKSANLNGETRIYRKREDMNISLSHRTLHFRKPARTSRGEYMTHDAIIITIRDEEGKRIGLGECAPLPGLSSDRDAYTRMSDVARLIEQALQSENYTETLRPYPALLFALESAMYDYQQNPLLYDTPFARSEVGIPMNGLVWMSDYDDMLAQVKAKLRQGFRCIKLKIGAIDWQEELRLISTIRSRFSPDTLELRVDANGAWSPSEAEEKMTALAQYDIHSIEQPIAPYQWKDMAHLCRLQEEAKAQGRKYLPVALDEELIGVNSLEEKRLMLDTIRPQYIVIKPTLHGGMTGSIEWASEAGKRGIPSWMTSALESNIGLRNVALLAARVYGPRITFPQGLGTGLLYTDNIEMDMELRGSKMWRAQVEEA